MALIDAGKRLLKRPDADDPDAPAPALAEAAGDIGAFLGDQVTRSARWTDGEEIRGACVRLDVVRDQVAPEPGGDTRGVDDPVARMALLRDDGGDIVGCLAVSVGVPNVELRRCGTEADQEYGEDALPQLLLADGNGGQ